MKIKRCAPSMTASVENTVSWLSACVNTLCHPALNFSRTLTWLWGFCVVWFFWRVWEVGFWFFCLLFLFCLGFCSFFQKTPFFCKCAQWCVLSKFNRWCIFIPIHLLVAGLWEVLPVCFEIMYTEYFHIQTEKN